MSYCIENNALATFQANLQVAPARQLFHERRVLNAIEQSKTDSFLAYMDMQNIMEISAFGDYCIERVPSSASGIEAIRNAYIEKRVKQLKKR